MSVHFGADDMKVSRLMRPLLFDRVPAVPTSGKWAKGWQILAFLTFGICVHRTLLSCLSAVGTAEQRRITGKPEGTVDTLEEIDWRAMYAKRSIG